MTKTASFNIDNRRTALDLIQGFKGRLEDTALILEDAKALAIADAEWVAAQLVKNPTDEQIAEMVKADPKATVNQQWTWDPAFVKEITISQVFVDYVLKTINEKTDIGIVDVQHLTSLKSLLA